MFESTTTYDAVALFDNKVFRISEIVCIQESGTSSDFSIITYRNGTEYRVRGKVEDLYHFFFDPLKEKK